MSKINPSVNGAFLTYLQSCGTQEQLCTIEYRKQDGKAIQISSPIVDIFTWQGSDYLLLDKGQLIRLESVVSVNDKGSFE